MVGQDVSTVCGRNPCSCGWGDGSEMRFRDHQATTALELKDSNYGRFAKLVILPSSSKGRQVSLCISAASSDVGRRNFAQCLSNLLGIDGRKPLTPTRVDYLRKTPSLGNRVSAFVVVPTTRSYAMAVTGSSAFERSIGREALIR